MQKTESPRHVLSLSGGKDSAALAIYMRDRVSEMEYIFNDTRKELPETYEYLDRIQDYLGKPINRLNADLGFDHWYEVYGGMIPSNHRRWCTKQLKLKPFEAFVGGDETLNYLGLRYDEEREGYISHKPNITPVYPFREAKLVLRDIEQILQDSGIGMPPYTKWGRSRSGCFFCFYQQKIEWVRLKETHPDLFEQAKKYERVYEKTGNLFTWGTEALADLEKPQRMIEIKTEHEMRRKREAAKRANLPLSEVFKEVHGHKEPVEDEEQACLICTL